MTQNWILTLNPEAYPQISRNHKPQIPRTKKQTNQSQTAARPEGSCATAHRVGFAPFSRRMSSLFCCRGDAKKQTRFRSMPSLGLGFNDHYGSRFRGVWDLDANDRYGCWIRNTASGETCGCIYTYIHIYIYTENNTLQAPIFGVSHIYVLCSFIHIYLYLPCSSTRPVVFHMLDGPRLDRCLNLLSLVCFCWFCRHSLATGSSVFVGELRPLSSSGGGGGRQKKKKN